MSDRTREILGWYRSESAGTLANLARLLSHGMLGGTGRLVILPVDQGFEHGPARSFAPNPGGYDPHYHYSLAIEAGCSAYAAPLGFIEAGAVEFAGEIPLILKLNSHDLLSDGRDPIPALTGSVGEALRLGCVAVGYTIYPGSARSREMYEQLRDVTEEAKRAGLAVVVWSYPRGSGLSKDGETAIDVVTYAAHIAAQLGAHIIKVKLPTAHVERADAKTVYEQYEIPTQTLTDRVRHVVQSVFAGRRVVIFSGGPREEDAAVFAEARAIRDGGGFGSIIGRNSFQRPRSDALRFLTAIMRIYGADGDEERPRTLEHDGVKVLEREGSTHEPVA
jgi:fructose-bisphosphate aldolase, class I